MINFKPGDKVVQIRNIHQSGSKFEPRIVQIVKYLDDKFRILVVITRGNRQVTAHINWLVPIDVYTSPLYEAMREDNEINEKTKS